MDAPLDARGKTAAKLVNPARRRRLRRRDVLNALGEAASPRLANAHRTDARAFVESDKSPSHQGAICSPGRCVVGHPTGEPSDNPPETSARGPEPHEPVLERHRVAPQGPPTARQPPRHLFHHGRGDVHVYEVGGDFVLLQHSHVRRPGFWVLRAKHVLHRVATLRVDVVRHHDPPSLAVCQPTDRGTKLPLEDETIEGPSAMLGGRVLLHGTEVSLRRALRVLDQHAEPTCLPIVHPLSQPPPDLGCLLHVLHALQDHRLEDEEPFRVPSPLQHPLQLVAEEVHEASTHFPFRGIVGA